MASPSPGTPVVTSITTAATSFSIALNSPSAGTLLLVCMRVTADPGTVTFTGYTPLVSDASDASDDQTMIFYRWADGTEGVNDTLTTVNSVKLTAFAYKITGAENPATQAPENSTVAVGTVSPADPGTVTPTGGSKDYLFIAFAGCDGEGEVFTAPANYSGSSSSSTGTGGAVATNCVINVSNRQLTAASENPGTMAISTAPANGWTAFTVAVHPPAPAAAALPHETVELQAVSRSSVW